MCKIRLFMHPKEGCKLVRLVITYCSACPYVEKRPNKSGVTSEFQLYWYSFYLSRSRKKKNKKWAARLETCPNWNGALPVETSKEDCPAGKFCRRGKSKKAELVFEDWRESEMIKGSGMLLTMHLMREMAWLEKGGRDETDDEG